MAIDSAEPMPEAQSNQQLLEMFLSAKCVEGCSEKTLHYYQTTIAKLLQIIDKRVAHITTDDLRQYLADYHQASHCSRSNIDNIRCILSSFFDARTKIHLKNYLASRTNQNPALFATLDKPHARLKISGVEIRLRHLGKQLGLENFDS